MVAATGAPVLAHKAAAERIGGVTYGLGDGDLVRVGSSVQLSCLDTPGHTRAHLCLYGEATGDAAPALFSGDTLFNAGVGNCIHGGDPQLLYESFADCLSQLPAATRVFPGHEYLLRNLGFTLDREPSNQAARELAQRVAALSAQDMPILTLGEEKQLNVFFRLDRPEVIAGLRRVRPGMPSEPTPRTVFLALRDLRNRW
jgi:hydroxyacylglutathione hydrolase